MMLWLARHGEAINSEQLNSDFDRPLSELGRSQVSQWTRWLLKRERAPELILHSPLVRTQQTAETIATEIGSTVVVMNEPLLAPGIDTARLLQRLGNSGMSRIACIAHQPDVSHCLGELIGGGQHLFSPGTVAGIEFDCGFRRGAGSLRWMLCPAWFE